MSTQEGFSERLRAARISAGMSQDQLAHAVCALTGISSVTRHEISRYERGKRKPTVWLSPLAEALGVEVEELLGSAQGPDVQAEDETRALLRRFRSARAIDPELVALLGQETDAIRVIDRRLGAVAVNSKLIAHIEQLEDALRYSIRGHIRAALAGTLAESHTLAGWQAIDSGVSDLAWRHFEEAKTAAREAGDPILLAHATGEQAYVLSDLRLADDALQLISSAYIDALPTRLRIWLSMAKAEMAACAGDERTCRDSLSVADGLLAHVEDEPDLPFIFVEPAHLMRWRANCLVRFKDPEAVENLESALKGLKPGTFNRAEAGLRCDMAVILLANGECDEAQRHAARAAELAELTGSVRQRRRVAAVNARLATISGQRPAST
ncbi:Helix-turn-helix domain [Mycobacterium tuberculosis]|nr:Helix-turn-helix domain [Mycobacterium tuberculosis]